LASSTGSPASRKVFVVTGPSGAGKGTMVQALLERLPELRLAVSATTRAQRPNETDGVHYRFLTREEFQRRISAGEFLEWVDYVGNRYGTLRAEVDRIQRDGQVPLLELELEGALTVKDQLPNAITIFVDAPLAELERRLRDRATESAGEIGERIVLARQQKELATRFDHVVENDDRERAADECLEIVRRELNDAATMAPR
jgi:guanylate kinase